MTPLTARIAELRALGIKSMNGVILELARAGTPGPAIGEYFGLEPGRVRAICRRAGVALRAEADAPPSAPLVEPPSPRAAPGRPAAGTDRAPEIRELAGRGLSAGEMATRLDMTRDAVIGLCRRRGIPLRRGRRQVAASARMTVSAGGPDPAPPAARPHAAPAGRGCHWPLWGYDERPTHAYCGAPIERGSYCGQHGALAYAGRWSAAITP